MRPDDCLFSSRSPSGPPSDPIRSRSQLHHHRDHAFSNGSDRRPCVSLPIPPSKATRTHSIPARRWALAWSYTTTIFLAILLLLSTASASSTHDANHLDSIELVYDHRNPPKPRALLEARQFDSPATSSSIVSPTTLATSTQGTLQTASPLATSLPRPFDTSLGNNFTAPSCPQFFNNFLSNQTFQRCLPLSLLLQTSNGFFSISRSLVQLTQTLDATCSADFAQCSAIMSTFATQIQQDSNCGQDLRLQNPLALQAYNGLVSYQPLYQAGCLKDAQGNYCYTTALTNISSPSSYYIYYLPIGMQLPAGSKPACNKCLQDTMAIFSSASANASQPLRNTYGPAAQIVNTNCGSTYVDATVRKSSASRSSFDTTSSTRLLTLVVFSFLFFI